MYRKAWTRWLVIGSIIAALVALTGGTPALAATPTGTFGPVDCQGYTTGFTGQGFLPGAFVWWRDPRTTTALRAQVTVDAAGNVTLPAFSLAPLQPTGPDRYWPGGPYQFDIWQRASNASPTDVGTIVLTFKGTIPASCPSGSPPVSCPSSMFLVAQGSDQAYKSPTDLSNSPQLKFLIDSTKATSAGRQPEVRVINYPATSVVALFAGLTTTRDPLTQLTVNVRNYLSGENVGLSVMWNQFRSVRTYCPGTRFIPVGYSQGAMVVHEFLNQLAASNDGAGQRSIIGVGLIADPERVRNSPLVNFADARANNSGVCQLVDAAVHCAAPDRLADVAPMFRSRTVTVCAYFDPVCDTSQVVSAWAALSSPSARSSAINLARSTHDSYRFLPATRSAGLFLGRRIAAG